MKSLIRLVLIGLFIEGQQARANQAEERLVSYLNEKQGELNIPIKSLDRGKVKQGQILTFDFPYSISGNGAVKILGIHRDCGCLNQAFKAGDSWEAQSKGTLQVRVDTTFFNGAFDKSMTIKTNEKDGGNHVLRMKAMIEPSLIWYPPVVELETSPEARAEVTTVSIKSASTQTIHIEKIIFNEDNLEIVSSNVGEGWELKIRWVGEQLRKPWIETIEVYTDGIVKKFSIPVIQRHPLRHGKHI